MKPLPYDKVKQLIPGNESSSTQNTKSLQSMLEGLQFTDCSPTSTDAPGALAYVRGLGSDIHLVSAPEIMAYRAAIFREKNPPVTHGVELSHVTRSTALYFIENDTPYIAIVHSFDPEVNIMLTRAEEIRDNHNRTRNSPLSIDDRVIRRGLTYAKDMKSVAALCSPDGRDLSVVDTDGSSAFGSDPILQIIARDGSFDVCEEFAQMLVRKDYTCGRVYSLTPQQIRDLGLTDKIVEPRAVLLGGDDLCFFVYACRQFYNYNGRARGVERSAKNVVNRGGSP